MRLTDWAKKQGISYRTAWEHFRKGLLPGAYKLLSGTIIVPDETDQIIKEAYYREKEREADGSQDD